MPKALPPRIVRVAIGHVAVDEAGERRVVEHAFELPVEELRLRVSLEGVVEAPRAGSEYENDSVRYCEIDAA